MVKQQLKQIQNLTILHNNNNEIDSKLQNYLKNIYDKLDFNKNNYLNILREIYIDNKIHEFRYDHNLCIINVNVNINNSSYEIINKSSLPKDSRIKIIKNFFKTFITWIKHNNIHKNIIINTCILIWISDRFIWSKDPHSNPDKELPICLYACPKNLNYIIIPDNTFFVLNTTKRYGHIGLNWISQKKLYDKQIRYTKKNKIFFRGADTTDLNHNLRRFIYDKLHTETDKEFKNCMIYEFLTKANYESVEKTGIYKFQLNLPGRYPWSTRLKYLYLSKSFIINVRVKTIGDLDKPDDIYKSFVDLFIDDKLMINIDMNYKYYDYKFHNSYEEYKKYDIYNKNECEKVYNKIKSIWKKYKNDNPNDNPNVIKANKLINNLDDNNIYNYYLHILLNNQKIGMKPITKEILTTF